jgi:hypothetical protein
MSQSWIRHAAAGMALFLITGVVRAQLSPGHDAWLMRNYKFTTPPPPSQFKPVDPVLTDLKALRDSVWTILRRAKSDDDYESALAAAGQAVSITELIGAITEHQQAVQSMKSAVAEARLPAQLPPPLFLIALKDKTINTATSYWVDGMMLNYITLQGMHVIVRLDLVDRDLSRDLNRQRNVELRLPE